MYLFTDFLLFSIKTNEILNAFYYNIILALCIDA